MYAVIASGGKQERVEIGSRVELERLGVAIGDEVSFAPVLIVDGDNVIAAGDALAASTVSGRVVGESAGPKVVGFVYKPKSRSRRRFGHRQHYQTVEITGIAPGGAKKSAPRSRAKA